MRNMMFLLFVVMTGCSARGSAPGLVQGRLAPCPSSPNCVCSEASANIAPITMPGGAAENRAALCQALQALGGEIVTEDEHYVHATFASRIFGFIDDLECHLDGSLVQIRSAARLGWWDLGVNRRRVEQLRALVEHEAQK